MNSAETTERLPLEWVVKIIKMIRDGWICPQLAIDLAEICVETGEAPNFTLAALLEVGGPGGKISKGMDGHG